MVVNLSISLLSICGGIQEQKIEPIAFLHLSLSLSQSHSQDTHSIIHVSSEEGRKCKKLISIR